MTAPNHTDLIRRLGEAEGSAIVLDAEIFWTLERQQALRAYWSAAPGLPRDLPDAFSRLPLGLGRMGLEAASPSYTASIDAALALVGRVLPGWVWNAGNDVGSWVHLWIDGPDYDGNPVHGDAKTPALALVVATLNALQQKEEGR